MNTKEAIEFLKAYRPYVCLAGNIDEIIELLKRGEKYEKIVNELETGIIWHSTKLENSVKQTINVLKQKYFPKGGK